MVTFSLIHRKPWGSLAKSSWTSPRGPSHPPSSMRLSSPPLPPPLPPPNSSLVGVCLHPLQCLGVLCDLQNRCSWAESNTRRSASARRGLPPIHSQRAKNKPPEEYDIEALTGNEKEYIDMDLILGVADLHSEKAVDAAEATMSSFPPSGSSFASSSSDSEDDSDEDGDDEPEMSSKEKCGNPDKPEAHPAKGKKPNKRQKIIVLN